MAHYKPDNYNSVSPYLLVSDAAATLRFLQDVFGATVLRTMAGDDGRIRHAEARVDDTVVMLADAAPGWPAVPSHVHVYVADVDAAYARALQAGAVSVQEPLKKDDEDKRGGVTDAGGTTWWVSTRLG
jgi:uncharacterized glyoxalase superfamily protein PhnB